MGSSNREHTNCPCNLIFLCHDCHAWVESNRTLALATGYLVSQHVEEPFGVELTWKGRLVLLDCSGCATVIGKRPAA